MLPTLSSFYIVLLKTITKEDLQIGQIIVFKDPDGDKVVKRLIALGPCDLVRNGKSHRVPGEFMWVEGDNQHSYDSRCYGVVPVDSVETKVVACVYPRKLDLRKKLIA